MYHTFNSFEDAEEFVNSNETAKLACWGTLRNPCYMVFVPKNIN